MTEKKDSGKSGSFSLSVGTRRVIAYIVLVLLTILCLFWFYVLFVNATRSKAELNHGFTLIPSHYAAKNFYNLLHNSNLPILTGLLNSFLVATCTAAVSTYFSAMTAYAIHAYDFKFKKAAFTFILAIMMIPTQVTALGFLSLLRRIKLMDSFIPLIVPAIAAPAVFFYMKQYMEANLPMELLESCDLPSRDGDVAEFLLGVADGVGHLHSLGLVHRDIKPGNILWRVVGSHTLVGSRVPRDRMPVLTDLGLLKDTGTVPAGSTGGTLSVVDGRAVAVGTPRYAAPEQLNGGEITPLVDVYALGMLANECFGGRPSGAWARIVRRATAAIPAQRYSSVAHFVRAIRHRHLVRYLLVVCALLAASALLVLAFRGSGTHAASDRGAVRSRPFVTNGVLVLPGPGW